MKKFRLCLLSITFISAQFGISQTGPGGVGSNTNNIFWLDATQISTVDGLPVDTWSDISGNNNDFSQSSTSNRPIFVSVGQNGLPTVRFDGIDDVLNSGAIPALDNISIVEYFCVTQSDDISQAETIFSTEYTGGYVDRLNYGFYTTTNNYNAFARNSSGTAIVKTQLGTNASHNILHAEYNTTTNSLRGRFNGSFSQNQSTTNNPETHIDATIGTSFLNAYNYDGDVSEIIMYNSDLNALERVIIENYLGAKYNKAIPSDFYAFESTHNIGVIGIGNNATNSHTESIGNGIVRVMNPSGLGSNEYLFIGHDNIPLNSLSSNVPGFMPAGTERFERQWRVDETGDVGTVTIVFELDISSNYSADPSSYTLIVDSDADFSDAVEFYTGTYNAVDETMTFTGVDFSAGEFFSLAGDGPGEIISVQDGNWGDPTTWDCNCIPTCFNDVSLDIGHTVTVDEDAYAKYFFLDFNSTLVMNAEFDLTICEDFEIDGAVDLTAGKIVMAGSADQLIDPFGNPMTLHDLEINNTAGAVVTLVESEYTLQGSLLMELGDLVVDNASTGILIVDSQSASTGGRIGEIKPGCSITGNVRVLRNIPAGDAGWRNVCSPVTNATLAQWDETMIISGDGFPDGCASANGSGCFHSVKQWVQGNPNDLTDINAPLQNGFGYELYVGDDLSAWSGGTLQVEGILNDNSSVVVTVPDDWNTQGNPYASPILFSTVNRNHIDNYFYIYDASTGGYQWYDGASNTSSIPSLANGLIETGQAFWTFDFGTLTYEQTDKVDQSATFIKAADQEDFSMYLKLSENNSTYSSTIAFEENAECLDGFDTIRDMRHLIVGDEKCPGFAIESSEDLLRKNWINTKVETKSFDLFTDFKNDGYYTIEAQNVAAFDQYHVVKVYDKLNAEYIDLKKTPQFVFYAYEGIADRFTLILSNELETQETPFSTATIDENGIEITQMGNILRIDSDVALGENVLVNLYNVAGQQMVYTNTISVVAGSTNIELPAQNAGIYILTINTGDQQISKKLVF